MKRFLSAIFVLIFLLPSFGPWMPHDALRELHVQKEKHHGGGGHDYLGHNHDTQNSLPHSIHFDVVTYFNDYLHVELKNTDHAVLEKPLLDAQKIDIKIAALIPPAYTPAAHIQTTGPPPDDWRMARSYLPVYLATQRLRI